MRPIALAAAMLALVGPLAWPLAAATLDARSLAYLPLRYSPGEEVLAQAILVPAASEKPEAMDLKPGSGLPKPGDDADPELRELRLARTADGWLLSLRFVPWSPGPLSVPALQVKGLRIPAFPYSAVSVLGPEDREPSPPRRQRDLPGTALYLYGFLGLLAALVLGAAGTAAYLVPAARSLLARRRAAQAFRRFAASLEYLEAEAAGAGSAAFFAALSRAFRNYLEARVVPAAPALTAAEIAALPDDAFPAPATKGRTAAFFARADRLRYGGSEPAPAPERRELCKSAVAEVRAIGEANEEALGARL